MRPITVLLLSVLTVALGGCYDPDLGNNPFTCAPSGKKCPDGYSCVTKNNTNICVLDSEKPDAGPPPSDISMVASKESGVYLDGAQVKNSEGCADEALEPSNNRGETATDLSDKGIGTIPGWEICYPGDVDQFSVTLQAGDKLVVRVKFTHSRGDLEAALLSPDGNLMDSSRSEDSDEEVSLSTAPIDGNYIIGVWGFDGATNTYDLEIVAKGL